VIVLQALASDDWPLWRELRLRALAEAPYAFGSRLDDWETADEARWRERLDLADSRNLIARVGGAPVGMATGVVVDGVYELISMWVAPEARGVGVGDTLVVGVCEWARERGAREVRLDVVQTNAHAIALYVRHGFVDAGPSRDVGERAMVKVL
jgi:ribosomal protein S18 acetylase RimI-like enzyme